MDRIENLVKSSAAMGAASVLETLGISAGEISQRKARATYRVVEINELKTADLVRAELQLTGRTL